LCKANKTFTEEGRWVDSHILNVIIRLR